MQKIPTLFLRDYDARPAVITDVANPECQWVLDGEGVASEKIDGTCCMMRGGVLYKRYNYKRGRTPKDGWIPAQPEEDEGGNWPGWIVVDFKNPADKWHLDALAHYTANGIALTDGTYELVGPKINNNPYGLRDGHRLWKHGVDMLSSCPRDFDGLRSYLEQIPIEGVVFHHSDGRMSKLKRKDFNFEWPKKHGR